MAPINCTGTDVALSTPLFAAVSDRKSACPKHKTCGSLNTTAQDRPSLCRRLDRSLSTGGHIRLPSPSLYHCRVCTHWALALSHQASCPAEIRRSDIYERPPVDYQEQFRSDLGYTGQPRSHLLIAAADPTATAVKGSTTIKGNQ